MKDTRRQGRKQAGKRGQFDARPLEESVLLVSATSDRQSFLKASSLFTSAMRREEGQSRGRGFMYPPRLALCSRQSGISTNKGEVCCR